MAHGCGPHPERPGLESVSWLDHRCLERPGEVLLQRQGVLEHARRSEQRDGRLIRPVPAGQVERIDVEEMVEVAVGDDDRVHVGDADVPLEIRQRPRSQIDPQVEPVGPDQVAASGTARAGPSAARAEDDQLHHG